MSYQLIKVGNPILRQYSLPVETNEYGSSEICALEKNLFEGMMNEQGVGLAAPQIGINKRVIVFGLESEAGHSFIPNTCLMNLSYEALSDEMDEGYEACLSVGPLCAKVLRHRHIRYQGLDVNGKIITREVSDYHARVVQHEIDHLNGVIFLDIISDVNSLGFQDELRASGAF